MWATEAEQNEIDFGTAVLSEERSTLPGTIRVPANSRKAGFYTILQRLTRPAHKAVADFERGAETPLKGRSNRPIQSGEVRRLSLWWILRDRLAARAEVT
jgi:hypothetical protein